MAGLVNAVAKGLYNAANYVAGYLGGATPVQAGQSVLTADLASYDDIRVRMTELHSLFVLCDERKNAFVPVNTLRHIIGKRKIFEHVSAFDQPGQMALIRAHEAMADTVARATANKEEYLNIDDVM